MFATFALSMLEIGAERLSIEGGDLYIEKALLDALFLTFWNLAVPYRLSKTKQR